ncbi:hypothetical protein IWZ00DRAFT_488058 [Phyllosticta capitalensis]
MQPANISPPSRRSSNASDTPLSPDIADPRHSQAWLPNTNSPSSQSFHAQTSQTPRRKPLPKDASPIAARFSPAAFSSTPSSAGQAHLQDESSAQGSPLRLASRPDSISIQPLSRNKAPSDGPGNPAGLDGIAHGNPSSPRQNTKDPLDEYYPNGEDNGPSRRASSQYDHENSGAGEERSGYAEVANGANNHRPTSAAWNNRQAQQTPRPHNHNRTHTMTSYGTNAARTPDLTLQGEDGVTEDFLDYDQLTDDEKEGDSPKTPNRSSVTSKKFKKFFGWKPGSHNVGDSPTTSFSSERSSSPGASPNMNKKGPSSLDVTAANAAAQSSFFTVPGTPLFSSSPSVNAHVEELERELRDVSVELAESIRRELDLEDEVERTKTDNPLTGSDANRRTSDYFSDSGASSAKFPIGDTESKIEALQKLRRKAEQERAQARVEAAQRLQDELRRRSDLEAQVQSLEEQIQHGSSSDRVRELEMSIEDYKRRLTDERQAKDSFQEILEALQSELRHDRDEKDNLKDEIIPQLQVKITNLENGATGLQELTRENTRLQAELNAFQTEILPDLRSRLDKLKETEEQNEVLRGDLENARNQGDEGLAERIEKLQEENARLRRDINTLQNDANIQEVVQLNAIQLQALGEENSKLQQELSTLRNENTTLANARRMEMELKQQSNRFNTIAEEGDSFGGGAQSPVIGLSRSNSLARNSVSTLKRGSRASLSRSNSVKDKSEAPRDVGDRIKDVEEQRDALHRSLKTLLARYEVEKKAHDKRIKLLEMERDRALKKSGPRRTAFHDEVTNLRHEVNTLRRRADDAMEQKWQVEKNLGGLRMDLARAELETSSLRDLLTEKDIFVQERRPSASSVGSEDSAHTAQAAITLDKAHKELQTMHALSLRRIQDLEGQQPASEEEAETVLALLRQSISAAEADRDAAIAAAASYRATASSMSGAEAASNEETGALLSTATALESLTQQVSAQLDKNNALRERLGAAIGRGEQEQRASAARITALQARLRTAEEALVAAQNHAEDALGPFEEELRELDDAQSASLKRMQTAQGLSPSKGKSHAAALAAAAAGEQSRDAGNHLRSPAVFGTPGRSPRLDVTTSGLGVSMAQVTKTGSLEHNVAELEKALRGAEAEMEEVLGRMNRAQVEVVELQGERYDCPPFPFHSVFAVNTVTVADRYTFFSCVQQRRSNTPDQTSSSGDCLSERRDARACCLGVAINIDRPNTPRTVASDNAMESTTTAVSSDVPNFGSAPSLRDRRDSVLRDSGDPKVEKDFLSKRLLSCLSPPVSPRSIGSVSGSSVFFPASLSQSHTSVAKTTSISATPGVDAHSTSGGSDGVDQVDGPGDEDQVEAPKQMEESTGAKKMRRDNCQDKSVEADAEGCNSLITRFLTPWWE